MVKEQKKSGAVNPLEAHAPSLLSNHKKPAHCFPRILFEIVFVGIYLCSGSLPFIFISHPGAYNFRATKINSFAFKIKVMLALATSIISSGDS